MHDLFYIFTLSRLAASSHGSHRCIVTATTPLLFKVSQVICAEPLKKKKKVDPQVLRHREERKKKKIEKAIKRLEKNASQLKPIDEIDVPLSLLQEKEMRTRTNPFISEVEEDYRSDLLKRWCQYKQQQSVTEVFMIDTLQESVNRALEELHKESEDLWLEAIQIDPFLIPFHAKGPVRTPPIKDYDAPDGEYINETKKWE
ncbi:large ribosomal subunit protein mL40-like [Macrobrachium nipponense]|uniref:large ribosomal subunit protein mL40-like n=1 Tax=Macrobrachium nipponense TaxID=159736 RepID=UPI0030C812CE